VDYGSISASGESSPLALNGFAQADPAVIAGQGTIGLEILAAAPDTDLLLVAIGGGGLISGVSTVARNLLLTQHLPA
jgi:threonine dehydratase